MRKNIIIHSIFTLTILLSSYAYSADGPYLIGNIGFALTNDVVGSSASDTFTNTLEPGISLGAAAGYGFPTYIGGPMWFADTKGLANVLADIKRFYEETGDSVFKPSALLEKLAAEGKTFAQLDAAA